MNLPAYPFAELERKAAALRAAGRRIHDLSIGDPDLPPPEFVVEAIKHELDNPSAHTYPSSRGDRQVRRAIARWFAGRFGVELDPDSQICVTIGGKEALAQIARSIVNPGETVAYPEPCYPVYRRAACFMLNAVPRVIELNSEDGFLPELDGLDEARLLFLNYPNNPTGASAPKPFLQRLGVLADSTPSLSLVYDMAYSEMSFGEPSHSILEFCSNAIEVHSLSKMANATGYRVGFVVGEPTRIAALVRVKEEMDSGTPLPFQRALQAVLERYYGAIPPPELTAFKSVYRRRKQLLAASIVRAGHKLFNSDATFYLWFRVGDDEIPFINRMIEEGVLLTPGSGFGQAGKGWARASITAPDEDIEAASQIFEKVGRLG
jgi:LL-diaminopimelate aminotransferase